MADCYCDGTDDGYYRCPNHPDAIEEMHDFLKGINDIPVTVVILERAA